MGSFSTHSGNIFDSKADVLVNPVNCVGVMGAGLAKQFQARFPNQCNDFNHRCADGVVTPGQVLLLHPVLFFATKNHWRNPSQIEWIELGMSTLGMVLKENEINSIAIPPIGCGHGGLDKLHVLYIVHRHGVTMDTDIELWNFSKRGHK